LASSLRKVDDYEVLARGLVNRESLVPLAVEALYGCVADRFFSSNFDLVVVLKGHGLNGQDALGLAKKLGSPFTVVSVAQDQVSLAELETLLNSSKKILILDGVFGTGFQGSLPENVQNLFGIILSFKSSNKEKVSIWSIDTPSGFDCENGRVSAGALKADLTLSLGFHKYAHHLKWANEWVGELELVTLDFKDPEQVDVWLLEESDLRFRLPSRKETQHKGSFGALELMAGSPKYPGALVLCASGAFKSGVG